MNTPVPAKHADVATTGRTGNTRSKSIELPRSERLHDDIEHGITLWAGPKAIITAYLPKADPDDLQIVINETGMIFNGTILSKITQKDEAPRRTRNKSKCFSHSVKPSFRVASEPVEVQKENGLITGIPKRKAPETALGDHGRDHVSFVNSVNHFFGEKGKPSFSSGKETILLHACERYLEYNGRIMAP